MCQSNQFGSFGIGIASKLFTKWKNWILSISPNAQNQSVKINSHCYNLWLSLSSRNWLIRNLNIFFIIFCSFLSLNILFGQGRSQRSTRRVHSRILMSSIFDSSERRKNQWFCRKMNRKSVHFGHFRAEDLFWSSFSIGVGKCHITLKNDLNFRCKCLWIEDLKLQLCLPPHLEKWKLGCAIAFKRKLFIFINLNYLTNEHQVENESFVKWFKISCNLALLNDNGYKFDRIISFKKSNEISSMKWMKKKQFLNNVLDLACDNYYILSINAKFYNDRD